MSASLQKRPKFESPRKDAMGHQQTLASSFNSLVGGSKERRGTSSPRPLALFRLIPSSNLVGCDYRKSSGLPPMSGDVKRCRTTCRATGFAPASFLFFPGC
jgi:hypothetical protein